MPPPGPAISPLLRLDDQRRLDEDVPCARCAYNLRGLEATATCPECGHSIGESISTRRLVFADRRWLRRVVRGIMLVMLAYTVPVGMFVLLVFVARSTRFLDGVALLMPIIAGCGGWMMTTPEPGGLDTRWRWAARWGLLLAIVALTLRVLLEWMLARNVWLFFEPYGVAHARCSDITGLSIPPLFFLGGVAMLLHLRQLAQRIPHVWLARISLWAAIGVGIYLAILTTYMSVGYFAHLWLAGEVRLRISLVSLGATLLIAGICLGLLACFWSGLRVALRGAEKRALAVW